jgi:competence protein ComEC
VLPGVVASARALGVARVETVVLTHPDLDHVAGVLEVVEPLGVREVCVPARFVEQAKTQPQGVAAAALAGLRAQGVAIRVLAAGDRLVLGEAAATILSPPAGSTLPADNDHALVALWEASRPGTARPARVLMTGDIGPDAIAPLADALRASPPPLMEFGAMEVDVMELPHHGAPVEASIRWVKSLAPRVALQSTGPRRAQSPAWSVLSTTDLRVSALVGWTRVDLRDDGALRVTSMRPSP